MTKKKNPIAEKSAVEEAEVGPKEPEVIEVKPKDEAKEESKPKPEVKKKAKPKEPEEEAPCSKPGPAPGPPGSWHG